MSGPYINDYLSSLHQQIYTSVERIKRNSRSSDIINQDNTTNLGVSIRSRVEEHAYKLLAEDISWSLQNNYTSSQESSYMSSSYQSAKDVLREPTVLVDFMFKNNQQYDFKV